ncbi:MAG TPA: hypothetical protein VF506_17915, partial [Streptosporangiaceae bacterium]
ATLLVSPLDGTVVVAGTHEGPGRQSEFLYVAYNAQTGRTKWVSGFSDPDFEVESMTAAAISPDGSSFYLTGIGESVPGAPNESLTVAAKTATGFLSWHQLHHGGQSVAVSPDSGTVYVVGGPITTAIRA